MTLQSGRLLDHVGWRLLRLLQQNSRLSFRQMGDSVGLTAPAVAERVRRFEDAGLIKSYSVELDLSKVGLSIQAFVHLASNSQQSTRLRQSITDIPEIIECYCVTGNESYIVKVAVPSVAHLENLLLRLSNFGEVRTSVVLSTQITHRIIDETILAKPD